MRILYVTTVGSTMHFFAALIRKLLDQGHTVDIACNEEIRPIPLCYRDWGCWVYPISCKRAPLSRANLAAVRQLRSIISSGGYDIVHCHTPVAGVCSRLACRELRKTGLRVFYTSHGFHFYRGAPLKNWLLYYPAEKLCARFTDTLITINREDFELARRQLHAGRVAYVPGVGVDVEAFHNARADREVLRSQLGIPAKAFLLISVGELNANKNQQLIIQALALLKEPCVHYLLVGAGPQKKKLEAMAQSLGVAGQVHMAGFRSDVAKLYKISDLNVFPSLREGLGLAAIEGMAANLPLLCADNRGTREYAGVFQREDFHSVCVSAEEYAAAIRRLMKDPALYQQLSILGYEGAKRFSGEKVNRQMLELYEDGM